MQEAELYDVLRWVSCTPLRSVLSCLQILWTVQDPSLCVMQAFIVESLCLRPRHGAKIIYDTDDDNRLKDENLVCRTPSNGWDRLPESRSRRQGYRSLASMILAVKML